MFETASLPLPKCLSIRVDNRHNKVRARIVLTISRELIEAEDVECVCECKDSDEENEQEGDHVCHYSDYESDQGLELREDSEIVEHFDPHEKDSWAAYGVCLVEISVGGVTDYDCEV